MFSLFNPQLRSCFEKIGVSTEKTTKANAALMYLIEFFPTMMIFVRKALLAEKEKGKVKSEEKFLDIFFCRKSNKKFWKYSRSRQFIREALDRKLEC